MGGGHERHGPPRRRRSPSAAPSSCSATTCAPSVRLAAISEAHVIYSWTPRLGRRRRGRPDPPAGRAPRRAAGHPRPVRHPPGRRQRDRGGLAHRRRPRRSRRPDPQPPGPAGARGHGGRRPWTRGAYVLADPDGDPPTSSWSAPAARCRCASPPPSCWPPRARRAGSCRCPPGSCSPPRTTPTATRCCPRGRRRSRSRPASPSAGTAGPTPPHGIDRFGARPRARVALDKLGINPEAVAERPAPPA